VGLGHTESCFRPRPGPDLAAAAYALCHVGRGPRPTRPGSGRGEEWFGTLQRASYGLAGYPIAAPEELIAALRAALPQDMGADFRLRYAAIAVTATRDAIDERHAGASAPMTPAEMAECWHVGYWMRALYRSLPDEARSEFAPDERPGD
jgi:hypothetical protein